MCLLIVYFIYTSGITRRTKFSPDVWVGYARPFVLYSTNLFKMLLKEFALQPC